VKLLAIAKMTDGALEARVHPDAHPRQPRPSRRSRARSTRSWSAATLPAIRCSTVAARADADGVGVWSDAIEIARRVAHEHGTLAEDFPLGRERRLRMRPIGEVRSAYYLRAMVQDRPGVLSQVAGILGRHDISIASVIQKGRAGAVPIVMMTHEALERNMAAALEEIDRLGVVAVPTVLLRVET
jgi:homoserine dehydrogenase